MKYISTLKTLESLPKSPSVHFKHFNFRYSDKNVLGNLVLLKILVDYSFNRGNILYEYTDKYTLSYLVFSRLTAISLFIRV